MIIPMPTTLIAMIIKQITIILNQKNVTLHLPKAHINVIAQYIATKFVLFARAPFLRCDLSHANNINADKSIRQMTIMPNNEYSTTPSACA